MLRKWTMTNRYDKTFASLRAKKEAAFVPFVTLCDPNYEQSLNIVRCLVENGADVLELGLPFSDPIADGPVIQKASIRALNSGATVARCFELTSQIRKEYPSIPMGLLVYSNLVVSGGIRHFYQQAHQAGINSVLIADVPIIESDQFIKAAEENDICPIFIATPNANDSTLEQVASLGKGYTYLLSRAGVTGTDVKAEMPLDNILSKLKNFDAPPSLLGFGISNVAQVKQAVESGVDGVISGSAVVKIIQDNLDNEETLLKNLARFIAEMKSATMRA